MKKISPGFFYSGLFLYICPVTNKQMLSAILFLAAAYWVSRTTQPPHHDTWEQIQTKANQNQ